MSVRPTIDEQLSRARALIATVGEGGALGADDRDALASADRLLERISRSWSVQLPILAGDNRALAQLLSSLAGDGAAVGGEADGHLLERDDAMVAVNARNVQLRAQLIPAIRRLGDSPERSRQWESIREVLSTRVSRRPG